MNPIGIYFAFWEREWQGDYLAYVRKVKRLGFDILELGAGALPDMTAAERRAVADAAREEEYRLCDEQNATALEYLKTEMEVNEISPENRQLFVDATAPVYDEVRTEIGDELVDMALAAQAG